MFGIQCPKFISMSRLTHQTGTHSSTTFRLIFSISYRSPKKFSFSPLSYWAQRRWNFLIKISFGQRQIYIFFPSISIERKEKPSQHNNTTPTGAREEGEADERKKVAAMRKIIFLSIQGKCQKPAINSPWIEMWKAERKREGREKTRRTRERREEEHFQLFAGCFGFGLQITSFEASFFRSQHINNSTEPQSSSSS